MHLVTRERLLTTLRQRHRLDLIALESPAGFGRSVLLGQAVADGPSRPSDRDILYRCGPDDAELGHLAGALVTSCGEDGPAVADHCHDAEQAARDIAAALGRAGPSESHVALLVDNVERSGQAGALLWPMVLTRLPENRHLVLSGRHLPEVGLARLIAAGAGALLDTDDLAFQADELTELAGSELDADWPLVDIELASWPALASLVLQGRPGLVTSYLREAVLRETDPQVVRALAAVASVGGCGTELVEVVLASVAQPEADGAVARSLDDIADEVGRLPLIEARGKGCWPHPAWSVATTNELSPSERSRVVVAHTRGMVAAGTVSEAGHLTLRSRNADALAVVVRAALATQPPNASLADLSAWASSDLLPVESLERGWLAAVVNLQLGDVSGVARLQLEQARLAFESAGDVEAEMSVLLHLGTIARARSDLVELGRLLGRGEVLAARGNTTALGLVALGRAVTAQMSGRPEEAIRALDQIPPGSLVGEWAAQALMVRGTNLLLAGRHPAAVAALDAATGEGSDASRAVAHDLLAAARWYAGDTIGALHDSELAEALARKASTPTFVQLVRASRACLLAATSQRERAARLLDQLHHGTSGAASDEADALARLAEVLLLADDGDLDGARSLLESIEVAARTMRSSVWKTALDTALLAPLPPDTATAVEHDVALGRAARAGLSAADHLNGGAPAGERHRPYLPAKWCGPGSGSVSIVLNGTGRIERDFRPVNHPAWRRVRVRELCLHLALVEDRDRVSVAAALWPDRQDRAAGQNLRVTLAHLLDVLDPNRPKSGGSDLILDRDGSLRFNRGARLHIDLWDIQHHADVVMATPDHERLSLLSHARRLVVHEPGPVLGGSAVGEWLDPYRRRLDDLVVNASLRAGGHALGAADYQLAQDLGHRALAIDPWSERAHRLVVEARLGGGDHDGARRALLHAVTVLDDLGVAPGQATIELAHRAGLDHHSLVSGGRDLSSAAP
jgi:LuxR family maltose regulon positive regulatory protein